MSPASMPVLESPRATGVEDVCANPAILVARVDRATADSAQAETAAPGLAEFATHGGDPGVSSHALTLGPWPGSCKLPGRPADSPEVSSRERLRRLLISGA